MFLLWKVGSQWSELTQERPSPAYLPSTALHHRLHSDHISINAGGRDANQFQPSLPVQTATKSKNPLKAKKPAADSRPKSDRQKKVKNPVNVELPAVNQEDNIQHDEGEWDQWDISQLDSSEPNRIAIPVTLSSRIVKKTATDAGINSVPIVPGRVPPPAPRVPLPAPRIHPSDLVDSAHNHLYEVINLRQRVQDQDRQVLDLQARLAQAQTELSSSRTRSELQQESQQQWDRLNARTTSVEESVDSLNANLIDITREHANSGNQLRGNWYYGG